MHKKLLHIGRAPDNDIILDDLSISKKHIQLSLEEDGTIHVRDVGSSNGTFINKQKLPLYEKIALKEKDTLTLGNVKFPWEMCFHPSMKEDKPSPVHSDDEENEIEENLETAIALDKDKDEDVIPESQTQNPNKNLKASIIKHQKKMSFIEEYGIYALLFVTFISLMIWYFMNVVKP